MENSLEVIDVEHKEIARTSMFNLEPDKQIEYAAKIASTLTRVIEKQGLFQNIQGKKYVTLGGWQILGSFLGVLPREDSVVELDDGSYVAHVNLIKQIDGTVIGGASALCSIQEKRWANADKFARRSMAVSRATGKAYRLSFSWIVNLAGYAETPAEEMPSKEETYLETPEQQKILAGFAKEHKVTKTEELIELSKQLRGTPMASLKNEIKSAIEMPFKS